MTSFIKAAIQAKAANGTFRTEGQYSNDQVTRGIAKLILDFGLANEIIEVANSLAYYFLTNSTSMQALNNETATVMFKSATTVTTGDNADVTTNTVVEFDAMNVFSVFAAGMGHTINTLVLIKIARSETITNVLPDMLKIVKESLPSAAYKADAYFLTIMPHNRIVKNRAAKRDNDHRLSIASRLEDEMSGNAGSSFGN
jgi:hypothetical protein